MKNNIFYGQKYTEKTLIESILCSFYILDYGYIQKINADKTVDVVHAKRIKMLDGTNLQPTISKQIEMLTLSGGGFSFSFDYKKGDKVLLLGLKNYIPKVEEVTSASETKTYQHYSRETMKALPLALFNEDAKVTVAIEDGDAAIKVTGKLKLKTDKDTDIDADSLKVKTKEKIELNGDSKQFVTWQELDNALQQLWAKIKAHTHPVSTTGTAAAQTGTAATSVDLSTVTLDISAAKTTTVVTGG